jgi:hypothetical protein
MVPIGFHVVIHYFHMSIKNFGGGPFEGFNLSLFAKQNLTIVF